MLLQRDRESSCGKSFGNKRVQIILSKTKRLIGFKNCSQCLPTKRYIPVGGGTTAVSAGASVVVWPASLRKSRFEENILGHEKVIDKM